MNSKDEVAVEILVQTDGIFRRDTKREKGTVQKLKRLLKTVAQACIP